MINRIHGLIFRHKLLAFLICLLAIWLLIYIILVIVFRPSHDRDWELGHEQLPQFVFSATSSKVTIYNYRDFKWLTKKEAEAVYKTRSFDIENIDGLDVFISHFDDFEGLAHIFLSFRLSNDDPIVVSLETRREKGETFSPLLGILRQFEIIYIVGSEEDIVGSRTGPRNERVYLYPTKATPEQVQELLKLITKEINEVYKKPIMYNTLTRNCTNELTRPVEKMSEVNFSLTWKTILPGYFDEVLYELGLIDSQGSFEDVKSRHLINNLRVEEFTDNNQSYSEILRSGSKN